MLVNLNQSPRTVGTFNRPKYYHELTLFNTTVSKELLYKLRLPIMQHQFLFVLLISVFLTLKSSSYRSIKHFHTLSFLAAIITMWSPAWFYSLLILLGADLNLTMDVNVYLLVIFPYAIGIETAYLLTTVVSCFS